MRLTFLGKETQGGGSPTLFATDRDTYIVQGWKISGQSSSLEIPKGLLRHLEGYPSSVLLLRTPVERPTSCLGHRSRTLRRCRRWTSPVTRPA